MQAFIIFHQYLLYINIIRVTAKIAADLPSNTLVNILKPENPFI